MHIVGVVMGGREDGGGHAAPFDFLSLDKVPPMTLPKATMPFVIGLIAGAFIISVLGFANDWVVTAGINETQVKDASINAQAAVCVSLAEAHLKTTKSTVNLEGYQTAANKARDDLARTFAVALPGEKTAKSIVITAYAKRLNKAKV